MWRHITGVKRPAETNNQQKDEDESKKSKRRRFNMKWTIGDNGKVREWLIYDRSNVTKCTVVTAVCNVMAQRKRSQILL